jgi:hypothetical protein
MKRLLAYLFLVLGLGLLFSVNTNASDKTLKSAMKINKKEKVIYSGNFGNRISWGNPVPLKINDLRGDGNVYYVIDYPHTYYRLNEDYKVISTGKFKFKKATETLVLTEDNQKFFWKVSLSSKVVDIKSKFYDHKGYRRYQMEKIMDYNEQKQINSSIKNFEQSSYAVYDDSDVNLNRLHKLIMKDENVKKSKYLKYSKKGVFNGKKIKTMGLAVFIDYEKELSKLTKDKNLKEISPSAWGWDYSTEDQSDFEDGWKAIKNCYNDHWKKKLNFRDGECILVDTRRITGDSQNPIIWENYLIKERDNRILIAKNLEEPKKTKKQLADEEKKKKQLLAKKKKEEEAKKKQLLLAQKKAEEETKKQEKTDTTKSDNKGEIIDENKLRDSEDKLMRVKIACGKSASGKRSWSSSFHAVATENTFQGSRHWNGDGKRYSTKDIGYEIFTGFKTKDRFTINIQGRYVKHSDRWNYRFISKGNLSIEEYLKNGITGTRGEKEWRRKCTIKYLHGNNAVDVFAIKNIKKDYSNRIEQKYTLEKKVKNLRNENIKFHKQIASLKNEIIKEKKISLNLEKKIEDINKEKKIIENKLTLFRDKLESGEKKQKLVEEKIKRIK